MTVPLFVGGILHIRASQVRGKEASQILLFHLQLQIIFPLLNNCKFAGFVDRFYLIEFEIKDTADTYMSASYLDLLLKIDSERRLRTELYEKKVNFQFICSSIRTPPVYGVYISQLIRTSVLCYCFIKYVAFCSVLNNTYNKIQCNFELFQ